MRTDDRGRDVHRALDVDRRRARCGARRGGGVMTFWDFANQHSGVTLGLAFFVYATVYVVAEAIVAMRRKP